MNSEGYPDKTADKAIAHVMKQQKNKAASRFSEHRPTNPHKPKKNGSCSLPRIHKEG